VSRQEFVLVFPECVSCQEFVLIFHECVFSP
jgi:hypothetical protein